ncbi:hypothetical protein ACJX0J_005699, partial [Zea mays]
MCRSSKSLGLSPADDDNDHMEYVIVLPHLMHLLFVGFVFTKLVLFAVVVNLPWIFAPRVVQHYYKARDLPPSGRSSFNPPKPRRREHSSAATAPFSSAVSSACCISIDLAGLAPSRA